jgi:hypothetical protein
MSDFAVNKKEDQKEFMENELFNGIMKQYRETRIFKEASTQA